MMNQGFLTKFFYRILLLDYIRDDFALEVQNACIKLVIGFIYLLFGQVVFSSNSVLYSNVKWLHPAIWGLIFIIIGSIHLYALFNKMIRLRKNILWVAGFLWLSYSSSLLLAESRLPGGYIFLLLSLTSFRCYLCVQVFDRFRLHNTEAPAI